jgi:HEAT repeat protein
MLATRLASLLQIRPGEERRVALVAALFALIEAGRGLGSNAADALFFRRFGVENLPYMFLLLGATNFLVSLTYAAGLGRFDKRRFFVTILPALAAVLLVERAAIGLDPSAGSGQGAAALYPVLWISVNIISSVLGLLTWNIAGEVCDARQAKRLFSLFVSAGILGGVAGNFATGPIARLLQTQNLLIVYAAILLAALALTRAITRQFFRPAHRREAGASFLDEVRAGFDYVRGSPLFKIMAVAAVLFSILYFSISFPFSKAVSTALPGEAEVAGFLGVFSGIVTAVTFFVSLFVANRLYTRLGVVNAVFLLPFAYLIGFVLFAVDYSLASAVVARSLQLVVLGGIAGTAYSTFFNVVPSDRRGQVRSFDSGVPEQIGVALSGVLLILGERVLSTTQIFVMGMIVAAACGALVWRMRREYGAALVGALRAGRFEVFGAGERAFAGLRGDANAIRVALAALADPKPSIRRLAAEMLARMQAASAAPTLIDALRDADPDVRVAAMRALSELGASEAAHALVALLGDAEPRVRSGALEALTRLQPQGAPAVLSAIESLLGDRDPHVRAKAAVALAGYGEARRALPMLEALLHDDRPDMRVLALDTLGDIAAAHRDGRRPAFELAPVIQALSDGSVAVRRAACRCLAQTQAESTLWALVARLGDVDASVRGAAAASLRAFGAKATLRLLDVLRGGHAEAHQAALDAIDPDDPTVTEPLREYARREIAQATAWRELAAAIPRAGRVTKLLCETLETRAAGSEQRLVKAAGLLGHGDAMGWVAKGLKARDAETRAAAVETLETLGDKQLAREIIPLLEDAPARANGGSDEVTRALDRLLADDDVWLRALAARAVAEIELRELIAELRAMESDADRLARESAQDALIQLGEDEMTETLRTVSLMERVLLLRDVPLFADLSPDDLKQIADVAREHLYADGALLCRQGEEGAELFVLAAGQVRVTQRSNGVEKVLATRRAGDFIGEMAIVESAPRSATVRAEGEVRALVIDGDAFKAILRDRPEVSLAVLRGVSRRLRELGTRVESAE